MIKKLSLTLFFSMMVVATGWCDTGTFEGRARSDVTTKKTERTETRKRYTFEENGFFRGRETSFDIFGTYAVTEDEPGDIYRDGFGGGVGINHFFSPYIGFGLDGYWWDGDRSVSDGLVSSVSGSIIFRWPMERFHIAPYIFGGGGGHFSDSDDRASFHGGLGLEYRFTPRLGFFLDGRYVAVDDANDFGLPRAGLRFAF